MPSADSRRVPSDAQLEPTGRNPGNLSEFCYRFFVMANHVAMQKNECRAVGPPGTRFGSAESCRSSVADPLPAPAVRRRDPLAPAARPPMNGAPYQRACACWGTATAATAIAAAAARAVRVFVMADTSREAFWLPWTSNVSRAVMFRCELPRSSGVHIGKDRAAWRDGAMHLARRVTESAAAAACPRAAACRPR